MNTKLDDRIAETAKAVVRRNTEEVQGGGDFALFDQLFADDFVDHTPQPGGTHDGVLFGLAPTGRKVRFDTVDVMRVQDGRITEHWGVAHLYSLLQQVGALPAMLPAA
jgi:hypothetical protein